ncbi:uncharacterized protein [Argopecten irradians]|uniref:uncharacterized protein n=1 Tax=Argopecten irradians TaxID=31199 RepID=UPI00371E2DFA
MSPKDDPDVCSKKKFRRRTHMRNADFQSDSSISYCTETSSRQKYKPISRAVSMWMLVSILCIVTQSLLVEGRYVDVEKIERQAVGPNPSCFDNITDCQSYIEHDATICSPDSPFFGWTTTHCQSSCNVCQGGPTTTPPPCIDKLDYCDGFGLPQACLDFPKWAEEKCRRSCGVCTGGPTTTPPLCVDTLTTCGTFHIPEDCLAYPKWAKESCRFTCKVCTVLEPPTIKPVGRK